MDRLTVLDCENTVPNRFALAVAVAGRARALSRGAERLTDEATAPVELALREIAGNRFQLDEIKSFVLAGRFRAMAGYGPADEESFAVAKVNPWLPHPPSLRGRRTHHVRKGG
ncbi:MULTISPECIES: DNA-directed RNA polymerase subunit omega [unclassified Mesorhizobium]|uniref:DNA-directed RNA polymerase subunit omega n=1 Tax=unclassified Mesorhizobium TaxID=325217 RepID=UPI001CD01A59|nr:MULTISPECIES: DNA-directed RNA polymerase subunit omega [unclassified Mesorhizobium]MBZ9736429.1 DNA-directed RNA polymerase subunit omega [Mesorhizobium sp. CA9]MBZ9825693.1 DNA-directed RNA polymerase subunit omega [Mesorhizobium sp. CA18]MBZ9831787.1 DNA-directed RNA polymerase subunit omega [Mesorhizobium sp. CA2]MBZ9839136.1 DNA-directed RNA polymerase subunit omega [Mesorhizobium sp. CA3]MBZ9878699.1 DNA-directed RNA polymerase subunit omega [Mesorhizobium sp. Ca11]